MFENDAKKRIAAPRLILTVFCSIFLVAGSACKSDDDSTSDILAALGLNSALELNASLNNVAGLMANGRLFTDPSRGTLNAISKADSGGGATFQAGIGKVDLAIDYLLLNGVVSGGLTGDIPLAGFNRRAILLTNIVDEVAREGQSPHHHYFSKSDGVYPENSALARAVVIVAGGQRYAFVSADLVGTTQDLYDTVYNKLSTDATVGANYNDRNQLFLFSTHTHSGPGAFATKPMWKFASMDVFVPESLERIANGIVAAIKAADQSVVNVKMAATKVTGPAIQKNRRSEFYTAGETVPIDSDLIVWQLRNAASDVVVATFFNFGIHATSLQPTNTLLSGDNVGWAMKIIEDQYSSNGTNVAMFINGSEGDISPVSTQVVYQLDMVDVGTQLGQAVLDAATTLTDYQTTGQLRSASKYVTLPTTTHANTATFLPDWLSLNLTLGDSLESTAYFGAFYAAWGSSSLSITTVPGEPITVVGNQIKSTALGKQSTTNEYAMVGALANGHMGYITDETQYDRGGYEAGGTLYGRDTNTFLQSTTATLQDCAILNTGC